MKVLGVEEVEVDVDIGETGETGYIEEDGYQVGIVIIPIIHTMNTHTIVTHGGYHHGHIVGIILIQLFINLFHFQESQKFSQMTF